VFGDGVWSVSVFEGDSVSLNSDTEIKDDDVIQWRFGKTLIAEINKRIDRFTVYDDVLDGRFRNRLKLDNQTGSLTITHITTEHAGYYKILTNRERKSFHLTVSGELNIYFTCFMFLSAHTIINPNSILLLLFNDIHFQFKLQTIYLSKPSNDCFCLFCVCFVKQ